MEENSEDKKEGYEFKPEEKEAEKTETRTETSHKKGFSLWKVFVIVLIASFVGSYGGGMALGNFQLGETTGNIVAGNGDGEEAEPTEPKEDPPTPTPPPTPPPAPPVDTEALIGDDAVKGDPNAPVTIIEWSDYECPFCERFASQTLPAITEQYIETGKVKLVFKDFPLSFHANAQKAAEAAECAGEQDKYYDMHDLLFSKGVSGGVDAFKAYAAELELDTEKFNDCLDTGKMADEVAEDMQEGVSAGITGTPGFIVNGQQIKGAQPFQVFQQVIESFL
jgi:protein-disulfide isomerase